MGIVAEPVQQRVGLNGIGKQGHPFLDAAIAGQHQRPLLIAFVDNVIQIIGLLIGQGLEPKVVDDQKIGAAVVFHQPIAGQIGVSGLKRPEQTGRLDITDLKAAADRLVSQGQGDVGLADAHRPAQTDVVFVFEKVTGPQIIDAAAINGRVELEVELFERLEVAKASFLEPAGKLALGASFEFILNQQTQKVEVGQLLFLRLLQPQLQAVHQASQAQLLELLDEMLIVTHRISWVGELTK